MSFRRPKVKREYDVRLYLYGPSRNCSKFISEKPRRRKCPSPF